MIRLLCILFTLCFSLALQAQEPVLELRCQPDSVKLGIPFHCDCILKLPKAASLKRLDFPIDSLMILQGMTMGNDSLPADVEVVNWGTWTPGKDISSFTPEQLNWKGEQQPAHVVFSNKISFLIWEPGVTALMPLTAAVTWGGNDIQLKTDPIAFLVLPPDGSEVTGIDSSGLAPLKPIITTRKGKILPYILSVILLFLGVVYLVATYLTRAKKRSFVEKVVAPLPAHVIAFQALKKIEAQGDWNKGELKKYYDELTHVLRQYLENRYEIPALESITEEILRDLKRTNVPSNYIQGMQKLLPMTDMVKFAKAQPHEEEHAGWLSWVKKLVEETKIVEDPQPLKG